MATNDKYQLITKRVFKGNLGKQFELIMEKTEVIEFLASGVTPGITQQTHIDRVNSEYEQYKNSIYKMLGKTKLLDMVDPVEEVIQ